MYKTTWVKTNIKLFYLLSDIQQFPENFGSRNDGRGKRFHQDVKEIETLYLGRCDIPITVDTAGLS